MVQLVAIRIHRRDGHGDAAGFRLDILDGAIKRGLQSVLADGEMGAREIGDDQANIVHVGHGHEQVGQGGCRHDAQVAIAGGDRDGVFQIGRQLVQEQHQRVTAQELLPGLRPRRCQDGRYIAGKLFSLAQLLGQDAPDATHGIGLAAIEADDPTAAQVGRRILSTQDRAPQHRILRQQSQGDHAVRLAAAHGLRQEEHRGAGPLPAQMAESPIHQGQHAVGEIVFLEEFRAADLAIQESVEIEYGGAAILGKD